MEIKIFRETYTADTTIGIVVVDGKFFGYCLEDVVRPVGVKVKGSTAIPAGKYEVVVTMSSRFKRMMPLLVDVENFDGVRIHGGNSHEDTEGCLLIASNRIGVSKIQGSLESTITSLIQKDTTHGKKSYVHILSARS